METIAICNLPDAKTYNPNIKVCLILDEKVISKTISKLKELGWDLSGNLSEISLKDKYDAGFKLWLHSFGNVCHSRLEYRDSDYNEFEVVDIISPQKTINLKTANTSPSATNCASCGGKLKDRGMGLAYKHCPKCEP
jgi:hypothetical protein